jgi:Mrp family chromosome partitioning ATPase
VVAVSSAEPGDGKTTCAANLALALAEGGRARVLLIEANLRSPQLAPLFGVVPSACFARQLDHHRLHPEAPWSVVDLHPSSLHLAALKPGDESRPPLDGAAFALAIQMLRQAGYDYVVLDAPPVLGSGDIHAIEDAADGVLLVARAGRSSSRALRRAVDEVSPAKLLGVGLLEA